MTIDDLRNNGLIILECISGSKAYGLDTPTSDTDIKGVFLCSKRDFYGLNYVEQISNKTNDIVFYELGRFMELLSVNNPNILELLDTPSDSIIFKSSFLNEIEIEKILSKRCKDTFGKFAISQIKKAKGLNKKIVNPIDKKRKTPLDFCYVNFQNGSIPIIKYLELKNWNQEECGLVNIAHMKDVFGLYHSKVKDYDGIIRNENSNEISLSSIPKGEKQEALLYFNRNGYSTYCKDYREYWNWVEKRNEARYENTKSHGKNYDAKNMMHTFRLLNMAIEIAEEKKINVRRKDRELLLNIKSGKFEYDELLGMAEKKQVQLNEAFEKSDLPDNPDLDYIREITFQLREKYYDKKKTDGNNG